MTVLDIISGVLLLLALFFFAAGTVGLFRFPDLYSRLHALTKADNAGLGLVVLSRLIQAQSATEVARLIVLWLMVLAASATVCVIIGNAAYRRGQAVWKKSS